MGRSAPNDYETALRRRGFILGEWIGGGAYGNVFRATQSRLDRTVAIKFFDNRFTRGADNLQRFRREARLLARVQHKSIPYVLTTGEVERRDGPVPFTVMEYIDGRSLERHLERTPRMEGTQVLDVMEDVLSALSAAHAKDVVHRDVKPANILLSKRGTYLIDFSIGVCLETHPGLTRATATGQGLGTMDYAPPEQRGDAANIDHRADVYSAGVVLAEMLGGRAPVRLDRLASELASVSPDLRAIVARACADDPTQRFESADAFLNAIRETLGPTAASVFDAQVVICPNLKCGGVTRSAGGGYIFGPKITGPTSESYCVHCGTEYLRSCPSCRLPLPDNIASLVAKTTKTEADATEAHCARCGTPIFITPTCKKCGSYLTDSDIGKDTSLGCSKSSCRTESTKRFDPDDIPF